MTPRSLASVAALVLGVGVACLGAVGLFRARTFYDRMHYGGPAAFLGPVALTVSLALGLGLSSPTTARGMIVSLLLATTGPLVAHATARAARLRVRETLDVHPEDAGAPR